MNINKALWLTEGMNIGIIIVVMICMIWVLILVMVTASFVQKTVIELTKKRKLKPLYVKLRDEDNNTFGYICICQAIANCPDITEKEKDLLMTNFRNNRPKENLHKIFYWNNYYNNDSIFWWTGNQEGREQRRLFLEHLIDNFII